MSAVDEKLVPLGRIRGAYGIKGWVKVQSYTEPRDNIAQFGIWVLDHRGATRRVKIQASRAQVNGVLVKLDGVDDRRAANELAGAAIAIERKELPPCAPGEYYWTDLEGLSVRNVAGQELGKIDHVAGSMAHDFLVLEGDGTRLIPFVDGKIVRRIDLDARVVIVDWDLSYWD